jgi:regulator of ribonuclease activity A
MVATSDICDELGERAHVVASVFRDFGGLCEFSGEIATLQVFEDNALVRSTLESPGQGRVLVVDGGGSLGCALLGGKMATLAVDNGWKGLIVNGCIRDAAEVRRMPIGLRALQTNPRRSPKVGVGKRDVVLHFAGAVFSPGDVVYADEDGIVVVAAPGRSP